jgi:hypothetical protein
MNYSPHTHLALARARHEDMLLGAERARLAATFRDDRPGALSRLRTHLAGLRHRQPRPVAA